MRPYLVMQRVEGETLEARLARGPLPMDEALALVRHLADAHAEVHAAGVVHRDLKPANIILASRGPKILDFGVATVASVPDLTGPGSVMGTPRYMSPEQLTGQPSDNRTDLWALGTILYRALTGAPPFDGATVGQIAHAVTHAEPAAPSAARPEVGRDLDFMVLELLRYNAACAHARAGRFDRAMQELREGTRRLPSFISDWPRRDPDLAPLHGYPPFIEMFGGPPGNDAS